MLTVTRWSLGTLLPKGLLGVALALASASMQASPVSLFFSGQFFPSAPAGSGGPPPSVFDGLDYSLSFTYDNSAIDVEPDPAEGDYINLLSNIVFTVGGTRFTAIPANPAFDSLLAVTENLARPGVPSIGLPPFSTSGLGVVMAFAGAPLGAADFQLDLQSAEFFCTPAVPGFCGPRVGVLPGSDALPQSGAAFLNTFNDPSNDFGRVLTVSALDPRLGDAVSAAASIDVATVPEPASSALLALAMLAFGVRRKCATVKAVAVGC